MFPAPVREHFTFYIYLYSSEKMKRTPVYIQWFLAILKLSIAGCQLSILSSCMRDENAFCDGSVFFSFEYTCNPKHTDYFTREVSSVSLYLFDEGENFYQSLQLPVEEEGRHTWQLNLPAGDYQAVAWGNLDDRLFSITSGTSLGEMRLQLKTSAAGEVQEGTAELFHGTTLVRVVPLQKNTSGVSLVKNTNRIQVLVEGLPGQTRAVPGTDYDIRITGVNGTFNFENTPVPSDPVYYTPGYSDTRYEGKEYTEALFRTLRLQCDYDVHLSFLKNGEVIQEDNLVELLLEYFPEIRTNEDLDRYSEYRFIYRLDDEGNFVLARITAGPWEATPGQGAGI